MDSELPARLLTMKDACLRKGQDYSYEAGLAEFTDLIEDGFDVRTQ